MGGHVHQGNAALYEQVGATSDAGGAVKARWLQSAGLQHLASPLASSGVDHRTLPSLLMQGYASQSSEDKQRLYKFLRNLNLNGDTGSEPYTPPPASTGAVYAVDGFYSPELRGELGAGLLDLHSVDDTELLSENVHSEAFEPSPFMHAATRGYDDDFEATVGKPKGEPDAPYKLSSNEKDDIAKEYNVAKIKVVVRKRPLNKKEIARKEDDIVKVSDNSCLTVHETKLKVDLTAYVEKHEFCFDAVLGEHVTNDEVYRVTVEPIIPSIFKRTKATCFAYGQTGSGKTFTMQPLPLKASADIVKLLHQPVYRTQKFRLWLSFFEIYGGKLYDLLSDRRKLLMREDGRQQVCIVGLQEFEVSDVQIVREYIEKGNAARSTGSTGANEESSRSHAILQLAVKRHGNESKGGKLVGKISFIDLAGSERGADTTDNDRQTRIEGAEINKSLLALKECIRALDNDQIHIPFRGSKLTEVLRDSFVGNSRTIMISCISPNAGSCEHTLNTLRYADRVKSLSKGGNARKEQSPNSFPTSKDPSLSLACPGSAEAEEPYDQNQEVNVVETGRKGAESFYNSNIEVDRYLVKHSSSSSTSYALNGREEDGFPSGSLDRERPDSTEFSGGLISSNRHHSSISSDLPEAERVQKVSPTGRKVAREDKPERQSNWPRKDARSDFSPTTYKRQHKYNSDSSMAPAKMSDNTGQDGEINALLEEEESLISAHRKEIEDSMEMVREEMKLLSEVDQPGSLIENYVSRLNFVLSRKVAGLVSLQARLARFQHRLKEQEILSRKRVPR
ncbi:kinesin-like protein KIN-13A isoform X1 [Nymphaea colorata]|nr:kinesin-like protein KIN-13A isoform X1 [Nymphaea colorata]XP_031497625.1 kinesin-like protein KIN-13A isoform X1 [Nymphaea colorata]XP_031497626.1 kinesin-like protein KIN-13A isoform X1 [Nymphaea colorata]